MINLLRYLNRYKVTVITPPYIENVPTSKTFLFPTRASVAWAIAVAELSGLGIKLVVRDRWKRQEIDV